MSAMNLPEQADPARIYGWAYRLLRHHDDALDATQGVLLKVLERAPSSPERRQAWLRRVTINHCLDLIRGRRPTAPPPLEEPASRGPRAEEVAGSTEQRERVARALAELSESQRLVLTAKVFDGETFEEIAQSLGIATPTAKTHYLRALRRLRTLLEELR